jgi:aldose 1-epimerase
LLPTGNIVPYMKFQELEILGDTFLDNCFLLKNNNKPACVLRNERLGIEFLITPDPSYPYLQVYTPEHRKSIAIENLSAAPDSFNNKMGLITLNSMESVSFATTFTATDQLTDQQQL